MLIPLGFLASSGASGATFELLESTVLTGSQAAVEFTNLTTKYAATYQHLQLRMVTRSARNAEDYIYIRFNGDTAANYSEHNLIGDGSVVVSGGGGNTTQMFVGVNASANLTSGLFTGLVTDILDPFETTKNKTIRTLSGMPRVVGLFSGSYRSTSAVSSITIRNVNGDNFVQFSRFSLYGIKATA